ncbi:MAG: hypothetical protein LBT46_08895 [Planctomycetaceae bacterium]|jgi:hypothetical protein|nr:hypothetical protein [Planctomycetaceae bacterium]
MEELILHSNEMLVLFPGEVLKPSGAEPLQVKFSADVPPPVNAGTNIWESAEHTIWQMLLQNSGSQTGIFKHGIHELTVHLIPEQPKPDGFGWEDFHLYKTGRIFRIAKTDLHGITPKEGDTLLYNEKLYTIKKTANGPCYEDIGNYNVTLRLHGSINRQ